jgi:urease subunit gamma/beta
MLLTPAERDRLLIFTAAQLARARRDRGLLLNVPETIALVADTVCEAARDGARHAEALAAGASVLGPDDVLPGVARVVTEVKVEAVFDDGTRLVVIPNPVGPPPTTHQQPPGDHAIPARADQQTPGDHAIPVRPGRVEVTVVNTAAVPVSVSSHFHFFEANPRLDFDRATAYGTHLDVVAGSTVRFDPGAEVSVGLVPIAGARVVIGFSGLVDGPLDADGAKEQALAKARECGFLGA